MASLFAIPSSLTEAPLGASGATIPEALRSELVAILEACVVLSPTGFRFADLPPIDIGTATGAPQTGAVPAGGEVPAPAPGAGQVAAFPGVAAAQNPQVATPPVQADQQIQPAQLGAPVPGAPAPAIPNLLGAAGGAMNLQTEPRPAASDQAQPTAVGEHPLVQAMWPVLYDQCYARRFEGKARPDIRATATQFGGNLQPGVGDPEFVARILAANATVSRWDPGWLVYHMDANGGVHVQKGDCHRLVMPGSYAIAGSQNVVPQVGMVLDILVVHESTTAQPGFCVLLSAAVPSDYDDSSLVRLYFNLAPDAVPVFVSFATGELNAYQIPFRLKCLADPAGYDRSDAVVLYVAKRYLSMALRVLADLPPAVRQNLQDDVPLFTKRLDAGIGAAEDPGTGESFGQSRMRLVCGGIVDAWLHGFQSVEARLEAVARRFAMAGLRIDKPYLNAGDEDILERPATPEADRCSQ